MTNSISSERAGNNAGSTAAADIPLVVTPVSPEPPSDRLIKTTIEEKKEATHPGKIYPPKIDPPLMDPDTALIAMMDLTDKLNQRDKKNTYEGLKVKAEFKSKLSVKISELMVKNINKAKEESDKRIAQGISSDVGLGAGSVAAILGFIGAIIFTAATGGAGIPALIAAGIGLTMATLDAGTRIAKATNATYKSADGKEQSLDLTLGGMVKRITEQLVHDHPEFPLGSTKENREKKIAELITGMTIFLNVAVAAVTIALSAASLRTVLKTATDVAKQGAEAGKAAANVISQQAKFASTVARTVELVSEVIQAASMVTSGAFGAQLAFITYDMKAVDNQKSEIENYARYVSEQILRDQDFLKIITDIVSEMYELVATTISNYNQSQARTSVKI